MTRVVQDSTSVVLKATHIVVLVVAKAEESGEELHLDVTLAETLKGAPIAASGSQLRVSGKRRQPGRRELLPEGPWAAVQHEPGARLVVFSSARTPTPGDVLAEPVVLRVLPAVPAEEEVRRAIAIERAGGPLSNRIDVVTEPPPLSPLFGEYAVARLVEDTLYRDAAGFDKVLAWLENPQRSTSLQMFVLQVLVGQLLLTDPNPPGFTERMALAALRILASTSDQPLVGQIVDTYLPNLLGLEGGAPRKTVEAVLAGDERTKTRARAVLEGLQPSGARDRILDWMNR